MTKILAFLTLLLSPALAFAASPALVQSITWNNSTSATGTIGPTNSGDSLIVVAWGTGGGTWGAFTNTAGSTVIQDVNTANFAVYRVASCLTGTQHFNVVETGFSGVYSVILEVSNLGSSVQVASEASGSSANPLTSSLTPAANNAFIIATVKTGSGTATFSAWTNSFTQDHTSTTGPSLADAYLVQASAASVNAGVTLSASENWLADIVAYTTGGSSTHSDMFFGRLDPRLIRHHGLLDDELRAAEQGDFGVN